MEAVLPADDDVALQSLMLPFESAALPWPAGAVLFLRARNGAALPARALHWQCEQSFKPHCDALLRAGMHANAHVEGSGFDTVLVLPPKQRDETRALLARAFAAAGPDATVVAALRNDEGARSAEADMRQLSVRVQSLSKHKCRVFWSSARHANRAIVEQWAALDAPRPVCDGRFLSRPGLFAWDHVDRGSALLMKCLPPGLAGQGADLGAGVGVLALEIIAHCPDVTSLDLFEAEARALDLARINLHAADLPCAARVRPTLGFHWHDVTTGVPGHFDFIVSNPPFHLGRAGQPEIGRAFIAAAAASLRAGGQLWLVANRHLPYEQVLARDFNNTHLVSERDGFKVIKATKAGS